MPVWSVRRISEMQGSFRLDAEFWQQVYVDNEAAVLAHKCLLLGDVALSVRKGIFYILANEYVENGVPFLRSSNVGAILTKDGDLAFISADKDREESKTTLVRGDIILSKTGREGAAIVLHERCNISQDVIGIRVNRRRINPYYLAAFLNSKAGALQMRRWFQGQVQMHLTLPDARRVQVPIPPEDFQHEVESLIEEALQKRTESEASYNRAQNFLLRELGLADLALSPQPFYKRRHSETVAAHRLDAEYFQPRYYKLLDALRRKGGSVPLGEVLSRCGRGEQPVYDDAGEVAVVNTSNLGRCFLDCDFARTTRESWMAKPKAQLNKHDVLLYSTGAYIGRTNIFLDDLDAVGSNHVTIIRPTSRCNPTYLALFLNSPAGLMQTDRLAHGSAQREIYPEDILRFTVWLPEARQQDELAGLIAKGYAARQESRRLLADAKRMVEAMILAGAV